VLVIATNCNGGVKEVLSSRSSRPPRPPIGSSRAHFCCRTLEVSTAKSFASGNAVAVCSRGRPRVRSDGAAELTPARARAGPRRIGGGGSA
jgi:hypothetical protein